MGSKYRNWRERGSVGGAYELVRVVRLKNYNQLMINKNTMKMNRFKI